MRGCLFRRVPGTELRARPFLPRQKILDHFERVVECVEILRGEGVVAGIHRGYCGPCLHVQTAGGYAHIARQHGTRNGLPALILSEAGITTISTLRPSCWKKP